MKKTVVKRRLLFLITKVILFQFVIAFIFSSVATANSLKAKRILDTKVTIVLSDLSLENTLSKLEKSAHVKFSYNSKITRFNQKLSINANEQTLSSVLSRILNPLHIGYAEVNNQIVLRKEGFAAGNIQNTLPKEISSAIPIKGKVVNEKGEPLPGATVQAKGSNVTALTEFDGSFTIDLPKNSTKLVISYIGMESQEVTVGKDPITVVLIEVGQKLDEIVVVGYGKSKKVTLTGAVASTKGEEILQSSSGNVSNSLAGRLPGLVASNRSGRPGADSSKLLIRGFNSFGGGTSPLVVVDGIPDRDFNRINPDDIESVTILKDASAAIYGVRSANGVILVTTKRGKSGKPTIHYDGSEGFQELTRMTKPVNAWQYMTYFNELNVNKGGTAPYAQSDIDKYKAGNDPDYTSTDWIDAVFRKAAPQSNHSLSIRGGNDQVKYYFSGQALSQESNFRNSIEKFKEFNIRSNIDAKISENIKVSLDIAARKEDRTFPVRSIGAIMHEAVSTYPFIPVRWPNGSYSSGVANGRNPVILASGLPGYDNTTNLIVNPNLGFEIKMPYITKGLSVSGYAAFDYNDLSQKKFERPWDAFTYDKVNQTYSNVRSSTSITSITQVEQLSNQNTYFLKLAFDREFGKHGISSFVGYEQNTSTVKYTSAYRRDLLSDQLDQLFLGSDKDQIANGWASQAGRESYLGKFSYNYDQKYLADITMRYNGSFNFPSYNRWGLFPAVSLGWRISEENFFKENFKGVNQLKLRASWGILGNDDVDQYLYVTRYKAEQYAPDYTYFGTDTALATAFWLSSTPNPNITWEKQDTKNIGVDAAFLDNRLNVSLDAFRFLRKDILAQRNASIPLYTGLALPKENIGRSLNRGVELAVNYNERRSELKYNVGFNFTYAKSKVLFKDESPNIPEWQRTTDQPINSWLVFETNGIYRTQQDVDASPHLAGAMPGDLWVKDKNGDGAITSDDKVRVPYSATPQIVYGIPMGLEYKGLALDVVWAGQARAKQIILPQAQGSIVSPPTWLYDGRWTPENPNAPYPRAFNQSDSRNAIDADFWLRDASFLRLKSLQISYTLPANIFSKFGLSDVKIYAGGYNLLSFDKMRKFGVDPETDNKTGINYPQTRIYRFGVNISL